MTPKHRTIAFAVMAALFAPVMGSPCKPKTSSAVVTDTPDNCVFRPEATWYKPTGCDIECTSTVPCIADAAVTVPCGCSSVQVKPTTTTLCPTHTSQCETQCQTGWGIATFYETGCTDSPPPTSTTPDPVTITPDCGFRPYVTWYQPTGCDVECTSWRTCYADIPATVNCGCSTVDVLPTTTTVCPTHTSQCENQCISYFGFGTIWITDGCGLPTPPPTPTP
ncbi:hypothetical protein VTJ04DRAFT_9165 [Mycothermus thermophilus]|uniref:uncharacterized protein n=1 Tax=Humicola insolens TaxID=85995 RepID=UPI00374294C1